MIEIDKLNRLTLSIYRSHSVQNPYRWKFHLTISLTMHVAFVLLLSLTSYSVAIQAISLLDALRHANASIFAQQIESDPTLSALYLSNAVKTVFAPVDIVGSSRSFSRLRLRASGQVAQAQYQASKQASRIQDLNDQPGKVIPSNFNSDKLSPDPTVNTVSHGEDNGSSGTTTDATKPVYRRQYLSNNNNNATAVPRIKISSGLGNNVSIIRGDIPYDGGLIHLVDEWAHQSFFYFSSPQIRILCLAAWSFNLFCCSPFANFQTLTTTTHHAQLLHPTEILVRNGQRVK